MERLGLGRNDMPTLPDWLDKELWESFLQFRKELKSKMTDHAQELAIRKLEKWRAAGHDPKEIIENSIINGWKGLFEPKTIGRSTQNIAERSRSVFERARQNFLGAAEEKDITNESERL